MKFAQFYFIYALWLVLPLVLFWTWAFKKRIQLMRKFSEEWPLKEIAFSVNSKRQLLKFGMLILASMFCIIALMRPQWDFQWQEIKRRGLDILVAIDTSKSMFTEDVKPNRLERSKLAVKDLIKRLEGDRIGLIAFSGTAFLQCPLTIDYDGFLLALNDLNADTIPRGGTDISTAIKTAMETFKSGEKKYKVLILITDGEDHEGSPVELAELAKKENMKIFCIGIGTAEGELIQLTDESGKKTFWKDKDGNVVKSKLDEDLLEKIALSAGGSYVRSSGAEFGLDLIYEEKLSNMEKKDIKAQMNKFYYERYQIPLTIVLALLMIEPFISDRKKR